MKRSLISLGFLLSSFWVGYGFSFAHLVLVVDRHLRVTRVVPAQSDFQTVEGLGQQARCEFRGRLRAINASLDRV
jgi:hypothetical protein